MRKTIAKPISLTPEVYEMALQRMATLGLTNFSAYVVMLIRNDSIQGGSLVMRENPPKSEGIRSSVTSTKGYRK